MELQAKALRSRSGSTDPALFVKVYGREINVYNVSMTVAQLSLPPARLSIVSSKVASMRYCDFRRLMG